MPASDGIWWRFRNLLRAALASLVLIGASNAWARPERIVSMNLCTDQLVLMLADRERIASVSYLAADPRSSAMAAESAGLLLNHGLAEEILPLDPDLVLAGAFTTRPTVFLLRKLGVAVLELPVASTLDDIRANIRTLAEALGERPRGEAALAAFDAKLPPPPVGPRPLAALYWANGYTSGKGTLANAIVEAAGFRSLGRELGLTGTSQLPLETLLVSHADVLVLGRKRDAPALANETFRHPALKRAFADRPTVRIADSHWVCGTPFVADAIAHLFSVRQSVAHGESDGAGKP